MSVAAEELATMPVFENLSSATLQHMAPLMVAQTFRRRDILYHRGDPPTGLFVLQSGHVILYRQSREKSQILSVLTIGKCFGGESLPNDTPSPYTAKAISNVQVLYVTPEDVRQLLMAHVDFMTFFLETVTSRLRQLARLVHDLAFRNVSSRLAGAMLTLAEADGEVTEEGLRVPRVLSQQNLAAMTGTAREVIYRTLRQFEQEDLLKQTRQAFIILDVDRMVAIATEETR